MQVQVKSSHIPELLEVAEWPQSQYLQNNLHNVHWTWGERLGGEGLGGERLGGECECVLATMQEMLCVCVFDS